MMGTIEKREPWRFNGDYRDLGQVSEFLDDYLAVYDELEAAGKYPYNAAFFGRIPGLEHCDRDDGENTAVYLMQTIRHWADHLDRRGELIDAGYARIAAISPGEVRRVNRAAVVGPHTLKEYPDARLMADETGRVVGILPKRARTRALHVPTGYEVLAVVA